MPSVILTFILFTVRKQRLKRANIQCRMHIWGALLWQRILNASPMYWLCCLHCSISFHQLCWGQTSTNTCAESWSFKFLPLRKTESAGSLWPFLLKEELTDIVSQCNKFSVGGRLHLKASTASNIKYLIPSSSWGHLAQPDVCKSSFKHLCIPLFLG